MFSYRCYAGLSHMRFIKRLCALERHFCKNENVSPPPISSSREGEALAKDNVLEASTTDTSPLRNTNRGIISEDQSGARSDEISEPKEDVKKVRAKEKLLSLLSDMEVTDQFSTRPHNSNLQLTKPTKRLGVKRTPAVEGQSNKAKLEREIERAVKDVSSYVSSVASEDAEKIQSELTKGIEEMGLKRKEFTPVTEENVSAPEEKAEEIDETNEVSQNLMSAVKAVASSVAGDPEQTQSELTKKLLSIARLKEEGSEQTAKPSRIADLFEGMRIDKSDSSVWSPIGRPMERRPARREIPESSRMQPEIDIFNSPPLNIFSEAKELPRRADQTRLLLWDKIEEKDLKSMVHFAPSNAIEEMIQWTEQGKHWKFPIDNEIDMGPEENVGFHEHVFLEQYLGGFPMKGPIRHFMELVVTGLSKNPYITVERKIENIDWFRQYFKEKEAILEEYGVLDS